jgi:biotin synthase-related radical SAM superfamily protein
MLKEVEQLKIKLMTSGMSVSSEARRAIEGDEKRPLTLADYASTSGISLELPEDVWVNAPIVDYNPNFVGETSHTLDWQDGNFVIRSPESEFGAIPTPVPAYHDQVNDNGEPFTRFGITHTDRVRISPIEGCVNSCIFCDIPYTLEYHKKSEADLVESVAIALADPVQPAKHIMISGGTPRREDYSYLNSVYDAVASTFPNHNVDVMMAPLPGLLDAQSLKNRGVNGLSINLELYNEQIAQKVMRGKHLVSRDNYLDFIERAVEIFGEGNVRSLLMVGLEPQADTLRGVEALAQRGCDPVLSPFRPSPHTPLKDLSTPTAEFLAETYERAAEIVHKYGSAKLGPRCIPCMHNTLTFPDESGKYRFS